MMDNSSELVKTPNNRPEASVIIVTYNSELFIQDCLNALFQQTMTSFELIIVDNGSTDHTPQMVASMQNNIKFIQLTDNCGFTGGNIAGLAHAQGRYICLLNPDTEVATDWLKALVDVMDKYPEAGICASKMVAFRTGRIDSAGDGCLKTGRGFKRGEGLPDTHYSELEYVFGGCGGAVLYRRSMLDDIGFLDDDFFLIYEDTDLNFRAQLAGWKCLFVPEAIVYHKVRSSIGSLSNMAVYYSVRNAGYVAIKNMPLRLLLKYMIEHGVVVVGNFVFFCLIHWRWQAYFRAALDFILAIPRLIPKRNNVMRLKRVDTAYIDSMMNSVFSWPIIKNKVKKLCERVG